MSDGLRSFFSFYGSKWRMAPRYPKPVHSTVIEPFAGSAGYALRHFDRDVILVEKDPLIASLWHWLIHVPSSEIRALPEHVECVDDMKSSQEAKWLVGFWLNQGSAQPKRSLSKSKSFKGGTWGLVLRERIASQVDRIRHWTVREGDYSKAPDLTATWFVDPPYQGAGVYYRKSSKDIDFAALGAWCRTRVGQVIVCENEGADWLPFRTLGSFAAASSRGVAKRSAEVIWP